MSAQFDGPVGMLMGSAISESVGDAVKGGNVVVAR
ncbi:hypothetical protein ETAA8_61440 [Anatilimnocola aggregata]|uniref:Uncharacterized protein n=1 Tax=Anatilimnocola aggregata TaxID=2528021 RepID=A0A517YL84_9BACT|nr:hypothetical protein ETAA8_61440 [Anatilimnocola aggregata]